MYIIWVLLVFLSLYFVLAVRGPSVWDRLLGLNLLSSKILIIVIVFASFRDTSYLLDYAIIYALSGFIGTIFLTRFWGTKQRRKK